MKLHDNGQPTFWQNTKPEVTPQCIKTYMYLPHEGTLASLRRVTVLLEY